MVLRITHGTSRFQDVLEAEANGYTPYHARRPEYRTNQAIPFRVSSEPFRLTATQFAEINMIGIDVSQYLQAVVHLYKRDQELRSLLKRGKPEVFWTETPCQYLFFRPVLILTESGFSLCEIETSPFGLALAHLLNSAYAGGGCAPAVVPIVLPRYIQRHTPEAGTIIYRSKTASYEGQMAFLAGHLLSGKVRGWPARLVDSEGSVFETCSDGHLSRLLPRRISGQRSD